jgi:hypothetical protein
MLMDEGACFPRAELPYVNTVTCAGHTTIGTGAYPRTHGIVLNVWWNPATGAYEACTDDPSSPLVTYGRPAAGGACAARILVPTLADELRARGAGTRVVAISSGSTRRSAAIATCSRSPATTAWRRSRNR